MGIRKDLFAMTTLEDGKEKMDEAPSEMLDLFYKQTQTITGLAMRVSILERLLIEKEVIAQEELISKLKEVTKEFSQLMNEALAQKH